MAVVWVVTAASANALLTPVMRCRDMPCCPRSDGGLQSCSTAQCAEQIPEKAEGQSAAKELAAASLPATALPAPRAEREFEVPRRELISGLRYSVAVFRLKDDLRT